MAQAGKFEFARGRKSLQFIENELKEAEIDFLEKDRAYIVNLNEKGDHAPKNYPYPMRSVYKDTLLIDGVALYRGMTLKQYNQQRALVDDAGKIGYWDKDGDLVQERASTTVRTGEFMSYGDQEFEKSVCGKSENFYYFVTYRFTERVLEYVKIQKVEKGKSFYWDDVQ